VALLARAAERNRIRWCHGIDALDEWGNTVAPWTQEAALWSLPGALVAAPDGSDAVPKMTQPALATAMAALAELIDNARSPA
jgi:hypothetical protein